MPIVTVKSEAGDFNSRKSKMDPSLTCKTLMTVAAPTNDVLTVQSLLETEFAAQGLEIVSSATAKHTTDIDVVERNAGSTTSISSATRMSTAYVFRFSYIIRADYPHGQVIKTFSGSVVDLRSGRIAASIRYSQGVFGSTSVEETVQGIVSELIAKLPCS